MSKTSKEEAFARVSKIIVNIVKSLGIIIKTMGEVEDKFGLSSDEIFKEMLNPEKLAEISKKLDPSTFGEFMSIMLELATFKLRFEDLSKLPSNEKIKIGERFIEISERLEKLFVEIEKS